MASDKGDGFLFSSIAAASAVAKTDLFDDQPLNTAKKKRYLVALGMTGSAAAGDTECELEVDGETKGTYINTDTGMPDGSVDVQACNVEIPAGALVTLKVIDPPATNPINSLAIFSSDSRW